MRCKNKSLNKMRAKNKSLNNIKVKNKSLNNIKVKNTYLVLECNINRYNELQSHRAKSLFIVFRYNYGVRRC